MTTVYIAGPMSGLPQFGYPAFHAAAAEIRDSGHQVVSPAELHGPPPEPGQEKPWDWYMRQALIALLRCDEVALLPGWRTSRGATLERDVATALAMPVWEWIPPNTK